jgi:gliding motility-associated-like protein
MLRQLIFILLFLPFGVISQIQSIEVCTENQEYMQEYWVDNPIPSQYEWIVGGGEIIEGQGTNNILVNWLNVPYGLYNISVCSFDNVFVPNCFTPNGDEVNNVWGPVFAGDWDHTVYNMLIFNRWGGIVWESDNHLAMWDGRYNNKMCQDGVYIWKMECKKLNTTVKEVMHGHLTLLR